MNVVNKFMFHQQLLWDLESSINDQTHVPECFSQFIVTWLISPAKHAPLVLSLSRNLLFAIASTLWASETGLLCFPRPIDTLVFIVYLHTEK